MKLYLCKYVSKNPKVCIKTKFGIVTTQQRRLQNTCKSHPPCSLSVSNIINFYPKSANLVFLSPLHPESD